MVWKDTTNEQKDQEKSFVVELKCASDYLNPPKMKIDHLRQNGTRYNTIPKS